MNNLSEQTTKIVDDFYRNWFNHVNQLVKVTTLELLRPKIKFNQLRHMEFGENLDFIASTAEGLYDWDTDTADEVICGIQDLCENLFATPFSFSYQIPSDFYQTPMGNLVLMARFWASGNLSKFTIDYPALGNIRISLPQSNLDYLLGWDANLFWKADAGQPYWASIPAYEGDVLLVHAKDFILDSSTNLASFSCLVPPKPVNHSKRKTKGNL